MPCPITQGPSMPGRSREQAKGWDYKGWLGEPGRNGIATHQMSLFPPNTRTGVHSPTAFRYVASPPSVRGSERRYPRGNAGLPGR